MKEAGCVRDRREKKTRRGTSRREKEREKERQEEGNTVHKRVWNTSGTEGGI